MVAGARPRQAVGAVAGMFDTMALALERMGEMARGFLVVFHNQQFHDGAIQCDYGRRIAEV
jgi:hypothetical protein